MNSWWQDTAMMGARLALQLLSGALITRGIIDAAIAEQLMGVVISGLGAWLSHRSRQSLKAP